MHVEVIDALSRSVSTALHEVNAFGLQCGLNCKRHPARAARHRCHRLFADRVQVARVLLGDHQTMPIVGRIDVHESERLLVFKHLEARNIAADYLAENAIALFTH